MTDWCILQIYIFCQLLRLVQSALCSHTAYERFCSANHQQTHANTFSI